jgi:4-carboxymuconolactone decarboxylase
MPTKKAPAKKKAFKAPKSRLTPPSEDNLNPAQQALKDAILSGPRGRFVMGGPFAIYMEAPEFGMLAQKLGGYVRLETTVPPRLSELAILVVAQHWRAQYEWYAHAPIAEKQGVSPDTIKAVQAGRRPTKAKRDETAIVDFVRELNKDKRVSDPTYKKVQKILGNQGAVELVGILGYYTTVSLLLNTFRAPLPEGAEYPFKE